MSRTADYVIQGFHYQLNKALLEILRSHDDAVIVVEGIVEDVEIKLDDKIKAIQCKYHEADLSYTPSAIYKPLLQMLAHYSENQTSEISYVLYAHFPNEDESSFLVDKKILSEALGSKNSLYKTLIDRIDVGIDLDKFLLRFSAELGPPYEILVRDVTTALTDSGFDSADVETLAYPNALHIVGCISILHEAEKRIISKKLLLDSLRKIKKTAISHWTLSLKLKNKLIEIRKKQLRSGFKDNSRRRIFVLDKQSLENFDDEIVKFIASYLKKYHFKASHVSTPIFLLHNFGAALSDIEGRLYELQVKVHSGIVANLFRTELFLKEPLVNPSRFAREPIREFDVKIALWESVYPVLSKFRIDDILIFGDGPILTGEFTDINVEHLASASFNEIKYMIGINDVIE